MDGGTSTGKTTFCLQELGVHAKKNNKKVLYICNRLGLVDQIISEISELGLEDTFIVYTYQTMQQRLIDGISIHKADYIIADECHYFYSDSFNGYTDLSFEYLINESKNAVLVMMSATAKRLFLWLENNFLLDPCNKYVIQPDYGNVEKLVFYRRNDCFDIINNILSEKTDSKILFFCNSATRMLEMYDFYKEFGDFYCSRSTENTALRRICNPYAIHDERFDARILFTTSAADNGINLKDTKIRYVFSELLDVDGLIQSFGRKRFVSDDDTCTFYVREYTVCELQGIINLNKVDMIAGKKYLSNPTDFIEEYKNDRAFYSRYSIFYPGYRDKDEFDIMLNHMKYHKCLMDDEVYTQIKNFGYSETILNVLGKELAAKAEFFDVHAEDKDLFLIYLESIEGKKLFAQDRLILKQKICDLGCKIKYTGINTFNGVLKDLYPNYKCSFHNKSPITCRYYEEKRSHLENGEKNPEFNHKYWLLE